MDATPTPPAGHLAHFAINSDDLGASRRFYESVFGWRFEPWGPPDFFHVVAADGGQPGVRGALQKRRALDGRQAMGFECTIAVPDAVEAAQAAVAAGGRILMAPTTIAGVGELVFVLDPSGNPVGAMRYDPAAD